MNNQQRESQALNTSPGIPANRTLPERRVQSQSHDASEPDNEPDKVGAAHPYPWRAAIRSYETADWVQIAAHGGCEPLAAEDDDHHVGKNRRENDQEDPYQRRECRGRPDLPQWKSAERDDHEPTHGIQHLDDVSPHGVLVAVVLFGSFGRQRSTGTDERDLERKNDGLPRHLQWGQPVDLWTVAQQQPPTQCDDRGEKTFDWPGDVIAETAAFQRESHGADWRLCSQLMPAPETECGNGWHIDKREAPAPQGNEIPPLQREAGRQCYHQDEVQGDQCNPIASQPGSSWSGVEALGNLDAPKVARS